MKSEFGARKNCGFGQHGIERFLVLLLSVIVARKWEKCFRRLCTNINVSILHFQTLIPINAPRPTTRKVVQVTPNKLDTRDIRRHQLAATMLKDVVPKKRRCVVKICRRRKGIRQSQSLFSRSSSHSSSDVTLVPLLLPSSF